MKNLLNNLSKATLMQMVMDLSSSSKENEELKNDLAKAYNEIAILNQVVKSYEEDFIDIQLIRRQEMIDNDEIPNMSWIDYDEFYEEEEEEEEDCDFSYRHQLDETKGLPF